MTSRPDFLKEALHVLKDRKCTISKSSGKRLQDALMRVAGNDADGCLVLMKQVVLQVPLRSVQRKKITAECVGSMAKEPWYLQVVDSFLAAFPASAASPGYIHTPLSLAAPAVQSVATRSPQAPFAPVAEYVVDLTGSGDEKSIERATTPSFLAPCVPACASVVDLTGSDSDESVERADGSAGAVNRPSRRASAKAKEEIRRICNELVADCGGTARVSRLKSYLFTHILERKIVIGQELVLLSWVPTWVRLEDVKGHVLQRLPPAA